jgi:hypothetical protein
LRLSLPLFLRVTGAAFYSKSSEPDETASPSPALTDCWTIWPAGHRWGNRLLHRGRHSTSRKTSAGRRQTTSAALWRNRTSLESPGRPCPLNFFFARARRFGVENKKNLGTQTRINQFNVVEQAPRLPMFGCAWLPRSQFSRSRGGSKAAAGISPFPRRAAAYVARGRCLDAIRAEIDSVASPVPDAT